MGYAPHTAAEPESRVRKNRKSFVEYTLYYALIHAPQTDTL